MTMHPNIKGAHDTYRSAITQIETDKTLSRHGKRQAAARAWITATEATRKAVEEIDNSKLLRRRGLEQQLLGPGPEPLRATASDRIARTSSFRDAVARCAATNPDRPQELYELLRRASLTGDALMERAVATIAYERGDAGALNGFLEAHPEFDAEWTELWNTQDVRSSIAEQFDQLPPDPPELLSGMTEPAIRALAVAGSPAETPSPSTPWMAIG